MEEKIQPKIKRIPYWTYLVTFMSAALMSWAMWGNGFLTVLDNPLHLAHLHSWLSGPVLNQSWFFGWSLDHYCGYASPQAYNPLGTYLVGLFYLLFKLPVAAGYKVMVFLSYVFPALALQYYLNRRLGWQAGLLGVFAWLFFKSVYTLNFAGLWAFTLSFGFLFLLLSALDRFRPGNWRSAAWIGLLIALITSSHLYGVGAAAFFIIIAFINHLVKERDKIRVILSYGAAVLIGVFLTMPYLWTLYINVFETAKAAGTPQTVAGWGQSVIELFFIILGGKFYAYPGASLFRILADNIYPFLIIIINFLGIFGIYSYITNKETRKRFSFLTPILGFMIFILLVLIAVHFTAATRGYLLIRFVTYFHFGMICFAALALVLIRDEEMIDWYRPGILILVLLTLVQVGVRAVDSVWEERVSSRVPVMSEINRAWDYLKAHPPKNHERVIVQDTYQNIDRGLRSKIQNSHILAMTNAGTGWPQVGSVDGVPETLKERLLFTEAGQFFNKPVGDISPDEVAEGMRDFHINRIFVVEPVLMNKLKSGPFKMVFQAGPFAIFEPLHPSGSIVSFSLPGTTFQEKTFTETEMRYNVESQSGDNIMTLKVSHYPLWKASVDGNPVNIRMNEKAMMEITLPEGSREVCFTFHGKAAWTLILFVMGLILPVILFAMKRTG